MTKKRTKLEIIEDLLKVLKKGRDVRITHLIYKSNLSNNSIKSYIEDLSKNNLIQKEIKKENTFYKITKKGENFLEELNKIKIFSESYGL